MVGVGGEEGGWTGGLKGDERKKKRQPDGGAGFQPTHIRQCQAVRKPPFTTSPRRVRFPFVPGWRLALKGAGNNGLLCNLKILLKLAEQRG